MYYVGKNFKHEFYLVEKNVNYIWEKQILSFNIDETTLGKTFCQTV